MMESLVKKLEKDVGEMGKNKKKTTTWVFKSCMKNLESSWGKEEKMIHKESKSWLQEVSKRELQMRPLRAELKNLLYLELTIQTVHFI